MEFLVCKGVKKRTRSTAVGRTASSNVAPSQSQTAFGTNKIQPTEIVGLTQRLLLPFLAFDGEEFGGHDLAAVLNKTQHALHGKKEKATDNAFEAVQMINSTQSTHKRPLHWFRACCTRAATDETSRSAWSGQWQEQTI
jgi:hypothetical protein